MRFKHKIYTQRQYIMPDGTISKSGNSQLGILKHAKKDVSDTCIICDKKIQSDTDYVMLNDLSPYYWHVNCLMNESPDFLVIYKSKTKKTGYYSKSVKLFIEHLENALVKRGITKPILAQHN